MLCVYVDETGNTGSNISDPVQRFHYVGAVVTREDTWESVRRDLSEIAVDSIGRKKAAASTFEFHGNQLFNGSGPWTTIPDRGDRMKIFGYCLDLLAKYRLLFTYARCDKQGLQRYSDPMHPHEVSFWLALERIGIICTERQSLGFIVADEGSTSIKRIARKMLNDYRRHGPPFGRRVDISRVIDTIHFMDSVESAHLQLCDLSLWVTQRQKIAEASGKTAIPSAKAGVPTLKELYQKVAIRTTGSATFPY